MQSKLVAPVSEGVTETHVKKWGKIACTERFRLPNGQPHDFLYFDSPSKPAIVFAITDDARVVTIRQFRYGAKVFVTELPGGCDREGQNAKQTMIEELLEETGYRPKKIVQLGGKLWFEPAAMRVGYQPFLALGCTYVQEPTPSPDEIMEVTLYPTETWTHMIASGEIDDDKSIAITWRALAHLGWRMAPPQK